MAPDGGLPGAPVHQTLGRYPLDWLQALTKAKRSERAIDTCNATPPMFEPQAFHSPSRFSLQATYLQRLGRHDEALDLYLERNRQSQDFGFEPCVSTSALGAWGNPIECGAQLARQNLGLGKAFHGETYAKLDTPKPWRWPPRPSNRNPTWREALYHHGRHGTSERGLGLKHPSPPAERSRPGLPSTAQESRSSPKRLGEGRTYSTKSRSRP